MLHLASTVLDIDTIFGPLIKQTFQEKAMIFLTLKFSENQTSIGQP